jgi:Zn-dependent membrane protease YugP
MFGDPLYWIVIGIGVVLSLWAAARTKSTFAEYSKFTTRAGMTGAQVAARILQDNGIRDVQIEPVAGSLTDHYDPGAKRLRLSEPVYDGRSMAAVGVAAHEVGHALQHAQGYAPLKFRSAWVPIANTGSWISILVIMLALMMGGAHAASGPGPTLAWIGILLFATTTVFTVVTLPVEFDASKRALLALEQGGYVTREELDGSRKVLNAAALTYVAAFAASLLQLLYWAIQLGVLGGRREE